MSPRVLWSKPSRTSCRSEMSPWGSLSTPLGTLNAVLQRQENRQQEEPCIAHKAALQACFYLEVDLKYSRAAALGCRFFSPDIRTVNGFMTVGSSLKPPLPSEKVFALVWCACLSFRSRVARRASRSSLASLLSLGCGGRR